MLSRLSARVNLFGVYLYKLKGDKALRQQYAKSDHLKIMQSLILEATDLIKQYNNKSAYMEIRKPHSTYLHDLAELNKRIISLWKKSMTDKEYISQFSHSKLQIQRLEDVQDFSSSLHTSMLEYILSIDPENLSSDESLKLLDVIKLDFPSQYSFLSDFLAQSGFHRELSIHEISIVDNSANIFEISLSIEQKYQQILHIQRQRELLLALPTKHAKKT